MRKWLHRISEVNEKDKTAVCSNCGFVDVGLHNGRYRCLEAHRVAQRLRDSGRHGKPNTKHCEICGEETKLVYDHDHQTGLHRGWLCASCNKMLGFAKDNTAILQAAISYLKR